MTTEGDFGLQLGGEIGLRIIKRNQETTDQSSNPYTTRVAMSLSIRSGIVHG
jgi:hypothetical protein